LVDLAVARIPTSVEHRIGDLVLQQVALGSPEQPLGPATAAVDSIMGRLLPHVSAPYAFRWKVIQSEQVNAFAVPGGGIVVFTGLLQQAESAEEVAGVLAHEIQHVVQRHSLRALVQRLGLAAAVDMVFGGGGQLAGNVAAVAEQLGQLQFSRTQEDEADEGAVRLLAQAGIRADGIVAFFRRLDRKGGTAVPALLSTHPDSGNRAARVAALAEAFPTPPLLPLDWEAVRTSLRAMP
jgi:predicted Zn-dependent protease